MGTNLFTIYDIYSSGYLVQYLDILSIIALFFAITVIINKNPIASLMSLIGLFGSISLYLILLGLTFIGFSYLIVYIGAVSILFLFILMLINIRTSELQSNNFNSIPLALFVTIFLNYIWQPLLPVQITNNKINHFIYYNSNIVTESPLPTLLSLSAATSQNQDLNITSVMFVTSNNWDSNMAETSHMSTIGNILYTSYNIWLIIASIILLLAMTGAIIITVKQDRQGELVQ